MMNSPLNPDDFETFKCKEFEWADVINILHETELSIWTTGDEKYEDFFVIKDVTKNKVIGCFTFSLSKDNSIGILKNLAIAKDYQRKGIGAFVSNNKIPKIAKALGMKKLYLHGNDKGKFTSKHFWKKTIYKHIQSADVKDQFYLDYLEKLKKMPPELLCIESIFYADLSEA